MVTLEWTCHICKLIRPDSKISVCSTDVSEEIGFPLHHFRHNVRYCNDDDECREQAKTYRHFDLSNTA